jgi:hypothetical protein
MKRKQQFVASDWLPLNAAFVRIGDFVGSPALAASDLHYALLGGLPSAYRSQDCDGKTHHGKLSPDFWRQFTMTDTAGDPSRVRIVPAGGKVMPSYAIFYFYVRRADFDQLYPTGKAERQGWLAIAGEIARLLRRGQSSAERAEPRSSRSVGSEMTPSADGVDNDERALR